MDADSRAKHIVESILHNRPIGILTELDRAALRSLLETREDLLAALRVARDFALESDRARNTPGWEYVRGVVEAAIAKAEGRA